MMVVVVVVIVVVVALVALAAVAAVGMGCEGGGTLRCRLRRHANNNHTPGQRKNCKFTETPPSATVAVAKRLMRIPDTVPEWPAVCV